MQTTYHLNPESITPARGWLFGQADTGEFETESGILVVGSLKKNPKIERFKVTQTGGTFEVCKNCKLVVKLATVPCPNHRYNKRIPGVYRAAIGDTAWMRLVAYQKQFFGTKLYLFVRNDDVVAAISP